MLVPDDQFYWESYKHEENLAASRGNFFLVGQSMLFAAYATLRAANHPRPTIAITLICSLGIFAACMWLLVNILHLTVTQMPLMRNLAEHEERHRVTTGWRAGFRSHNLMGIYLPVGILITWILLLVLQGT